MLPSSELTVHGPSSSGIFRVAFKLLCLKQDVIVDAMGIEALTFEQYLQGERQVPRATSSVVCGMLLQQSEYLKKAAEVLEASLVSEYKELSLLDEARTAAETQRQPNPLQS